MKATKNKPISAQQLRALHAMLNKAGINEEARHNLIHSFTDGRTSSSKELTFDEARILLSRLSEQQNSRIRELQRKEAIVLCRAIYALSFEIKFLNKGFASETEEDKQMNLAKINMFCRTRSKVRKNLSQMDLEELQDIKRQLEAIARKEEK